MTQSRRRSIALLIASFLAGLGAPQRAPAQANPCALRGPHAWIVPDDVFTANALGDQNRYKGAALARLFARSGVTVRSDPADTLAVADDRDVYGGAAVDTALVWQAFGIESAGSPYFHDLLVQSSGQAPVSFTLTFDRPVRLVRFVRAGLLGGLSGITHPYWSATAVDSTGKTVATVREDMIMSYSAVPPQSFDLTGRSPIAAITFTGNNEHFAAFSNLVMQLIGWCR
jgi:hypothetical protein